MRKRSVLKPVHQLQKIDWKRWHMLWDKNWYSVIFRDLKQNNLDEPDGWINYWQDLPRKLTNIFSRVQDEGSVMI